MNFSFTAKQNRPKRDKEHQLQCACVRWFRLQYPQHGTMLFAVPNGGRRDPITGARLKEEGVVAGVADLVLLVPNNTHHALLIELKTHNGRQSASQRAWQATAEKHGYKYVVCRDAEQFVNQVQQYLND